MVYVFRASLKHGSSWYIPYLIPWRLALHCVSVASLTIYVI